MTAHPQEDQDSFSEYLKYLRDRVDSLEKRLQESQETLHGVLNTVNVKGDQKTWEAVLVYLSEHEDNKRSR